MAETSLSPEERDALAAELALGLLDGEERAAALRSLMGSPDFTPDIIDAWHRRLAPFYENYAPVPPPAALWAGIETRIPAPVAASDQLAQRLRLWRGGAIAASAIAAALALALLLRPTPTPIGAPPATQVAVARMASTPDGPTILARFDPTTNQLVLRPSGIKAGALVPELWVIPADGKPRSLGLIGAETDSHIAVDSANRIFMAEGATLAVTMEPAGGAPHEAPSSAPIAAGQISLI